MSDNDTSYATARDRAAARRAEENQRYDEYGLEKPAVSWTERLNDYAYPDEVAQATDKPWHADLQAVGTIPASLYGHAMDAVSPFDTRGDLHPTLPIVGEIAHDAEKTRYQQARAEAEASAGQVCEEEVPGAFDHYAD
jgi:hypothetical protein